MCPLFLLVLLSSGAKWICPAANANDILMPGDDQRLCNHLFRDYVTIWGRGWLSSVACCSRDMENSSALKKKKSKSSGSSDRKEEEPPATTQVGR